ncbi:alpha/beta hydrolase [Gangjinia marincola]
MPTYLVKIGQLLQAISPRLAMRYAAILFLTPFTYSLPKREKKMFDNALQHDIKLPKSKKNIVVYEYGDSAKKVLLVHGWSGTGTQLASIAEELIKHGYSTVSFDAPAHGQARGSRSQMPYFIEAIHHLQKQFGPFEYAIGHSLGGMSLLRSIKEGLKLKKLVIIGTANSVTAITEDFIQNMQLKPQIAHLLKSHLDKEFGQDLDDYAGARSAKAVKIPTLVVHDKNDVDVHYSSGQEINDALAEGELYLTKGLGHRKILGNQKTIEKIVSFLLA